MLSLIDQKLLERCLNLLPSSKDSVAHCSTMAPPQENDNVSQSAEDSTDLPQLLLKLLNQEGQLNSLQLSNLLNVDHQKIVGAIKSLCCLQDVREYFLI